MRVAVVSVRPPADDDAAAERLARTVDRLADRGHEVTVFCSRFWAEAGFEREQDDVRYVAVTGTDRFAWLFALFLPVVLLANRPDVVHARYAPVVQVLGAKWASVLSRTPLVVDWYGDDPDPGPAPLVRLAVRWPTRVLAPSRVVRTWLRELGCDGDRIVVVPESVDMDLVRSLPVIGDADVVYARRLDGDANLESLLLALAELREHDWSALVIGDGPERAAYEAQARDLRIDDRVRFISDLPLEDRIARYRGARAFVQTATRECFARELLWALAAGCVGVVEYQADSSAHELVEHRERGIRTTDDEELSEAILAAMEMAPSDLNDDFAEFDGELLVERVEGCYRSAREEFGLV